MPEEITVDVLKQLLDVRDQAARAITDGLEKKFDERLAKIDDDVIRGLRSIQQGKQTSKTFALLNGESVQTLSSALMETKAWQDRPQELKRSSMIEATINIKDISGLGLTRPIPVPGIAGGPKQALRVRDLIPSSLVTGGGAVTFTREASFTNMAEAVAETAVKPKSDKTFQTKTLPFEVIAHYVKVSRQSYNDVNGLPAELDSNLIYGLSLKLESEILKGSGVSPHIGPGLYSVATPMAAPGGTPTMIDTIFLASAQLAAAGWNATGVVMNAADYTSMQLLKSSTGEYLLGSVPALPPIVVSPYLAAGQWIVGDFSQVHLYLREEANVQVSYFNEDDFIRNMVCVLAELRAALAVFQPAALLKAPGTMEREAEPEKPHTARR